MGASKSRPNQSSFFSKENFDKYRNMLRGYKKPEPSMIPKEPAVVEEKPVVEQKQEDNYVMKYVIFKDLSKLIGVVFPKNISHDDIRIGGQWKPVAAGFYNTLHKTCFGESISLNLSSTPYDEVVIKHSAQIIDGYHQKELSDFGDKHYKSVID